MHSMNDLRARIEAIFPKMVQLRREFHQAPELSFCEENTPRRVAEILQQLGFHVRTNVGGRGVVGILEGGKPGKTVALRADMDALPIQDEKEDCPYRSRVPGVMHACGHDGHTASLLGVAEILAEIREEIAGRFVLLFQHAEEVVPGGAQAMIADHALDGVDAIYGVHLWTPFPYGIIGLREGRLMAAADSFHIEVIGKGGHGGLPHTTTDAIVAASHLIVNLQSIISRRLNPLQSGVISVGHVHGGKAYNIIAERCVIDGTVRSFDPDIRQMLKEQIERTTKQTCEMVGAQCEIQYDWGYPPVVNDGTEAKRMIKVAQSMIGDKNTWEISPLMAGEDFSYYLHKIPGCFAMVGAGNEEKGYTYPHHHPRFNFDERVMKTSAELLIRSGIDYLTTHDQTIVQNLSRS
ncbi:M20 metallopeptidase family protein [Marininema halotolerans]|uniref:Amidohydrolase n=1 Tax=Marininema halotolerans TaxID=1155944 RepID=A0A1I6RNE2_9BACL|nr:amidohydrolase [Marininema halotolerans]SFS66156.1 amidohydrolase [Marininema halotolerans]